MSQNITASKLKESLEEPHGEFKGVISEWFLEIRDRIEKELDGLCLNYRGFPQINLPERYFPRIDLFESIDVVKNLRERIVETTFSPEIENLKEDYIRMLDCRIKEIQFESRDWLVPEKEVEEIERIPLYDEEQKFSAFEAPDINPVVRFKNTISDYNTSELEFLSEILRARNYGFDSPQAVMIDTIRASKGEDIESDKLLSIITSKEDEKSSIETRVERMLEKMNPYLLGVCLARTSDIIVEDREELKSKMSTIVPRRMSLGVSLPFGEADNEGFTENFLLLCTDETSLEAVKEYASDDSVSERHYDSKKELYERDVKIGESVFTHEFGHLVSGILSITDAPGMKQEDNIIKFRYNIKDKVRESYKEHTDKLTHMVENRHEFVAYSFDLWINNPKKLEEEYEKIYTLLENTLSKDIHIEELKHKDKIV